MKICSNKNLGKVYKKKLKKIYIIIIKIRGIKCTLMKTLNKILWFMIIMLNNNNSKILEVIFHSPKNNKKKPFKLKKNTVWKMNFMKKKTMKKKKK